MMKKIVLGSFMLTTALSLQAQHDYDSQGVIYSNSNKVGIGTSSPASKLTLEGTTSGSPGRDFLRLTNNSTDSYSQVHGVLQSDDSGHLIIYQGSKHYTKYKGDKFRQIGGLINKGNGLFLKSVSSGETLSGYGDATGKIIFETGSNPLDTTTERMRITEDGNIGIWTSTPSETLTIANLSDGRGNISLMDPDHTNADGVDPGDIIFQAGSYYNKKQLGRIWATVTADATPGLNLSSGDVDADIYIDENGDVGIGTDNLETGAKLTVKGQIHSRSIKVTANAGADFVFEENYNLLDLSEVERFVKENKHLPEIPTACEMEDEGYDMGEFQVKLLQKIEELTLYTIEQQKLIKKQQQRLDQLEVKYSSRNSKK